MTILEQEGQDGKSGPGEILKVGDIFAQHYQIIKLLGRGRLGTVYQAMDTHLNEKLALKIFQSDLSQSAAMINRFREKIKRIRKINSSSVVRLHSFSMEKGLYYLVMELVEGTNLEDIMGNRALGSEKAADYLTRIATCLHAVHRQQLVHENLKPRNIIVQSEDSLKIIDFGFTSPEDISRYPGLFDARYMAPEQLYPLDPAPTVDIYALGVIYYQMLCGRLPFKSTEPSELALEHARVIPQPPSHCNKDVTRADDLICVKMLQKNPDQRFHDAAQVLAVLHHKAEICPRCLRLIQFQGRCPQCEEYTVLATDTGRGLDQSSIANTDHTKRSKALVSLRDLKTRLKAKLDLRHEDNCFHCGKSLPFGFPFCTNCQLDSPFTGRTEATHLLVLDPDRNADKKQLFKTLRQLGLATPSGIHSKASFKFPFVIQIRDQPERAGELIDLLSAHGFQLHPINVEMAEERLRYNSWLLPIISGVTTCACFFVHGYLAVPFLVLTAFLIYRNFSGLHLPTIPLSLKKLPGFFSSQVYDEAKKTTILTRPHEFLRSVYESLLFQAFKLIKIMSQSTQTQNLFADIIRSIDQLVFQAGLNVQALLLLEKDFDLNKENEIIRQVVHFEQKLKEDWPSAQRAELKQKLEAVQQQRLEYCQRAERLTGHYNTLLDILNSLNKMVPKINTILSEIVTYDAGLKIEENALIDEVLDELSTLEHGFNQLQNLQGKEV
ncbi:protein kinase [bacterium]|nr:protein kinase [bacterium]